MRHPADSPVWKYFDNLYPKFASEPRNVRLGLAADGFNPFKAMNVSHSSWPVTMMPYNLPPWLCMKQPHMMMTLLIDGPSSPGNNIGVYLRLVVDELKELWENGVDTYDVETNQMFRMHAVLLWTINDFPAYAILFGWSTKGALACPCWANVLQQLGPKFKLNSKRQQSSKWNRKGKENEDSGHNWKKKSIFFELSYWEHNLISHNLDVTHIEKNMCDNVLWTILNVDGKGKDNLNTRRDLQDMGIRKALHPQKRVGNEYYLPPACFAMNNREKSLFCTLLKNIKVPDGYASNISRWVNLKQRSISGLKSHDNHILMQQILPIAVRNLLPKKVVEPLIELSNFFKQLCFKTLEVDGLNRLQSQIALTLCHLERIFPPSFFDIMEHLPIHLAEEAKIAGPVQYRWMYFIERYLMTLKSYMRNRSHPEGSIAQGYLVEECMTFCSRYLHDVESKLHRPLRNCDVSDNPEILMGRALGKGKGFVLDNTTWVQAHRYMLFNITVVVPYGEEHREFIKRSHRRLRDYDVDRRHNDEFPKWFNSHVAKLLTTENVALSDEIKILALRPIQKATRFNGYIINGTRYHTES
ncbi:uncharacterized protein LOC114312932 [Camellia sinensis]|uniref:uncharacterized protein LOC114312932 n=1 Tax=Camellia sinensis TaxID=4442 RepID=UPI0010359699|nr:uncharacterized protein LOC114312932 [Camellia sinensis]